MEKQCRCDATTTAVAGPARRGQGSWNGPGPYFLQVTSNAHTCLPGMFLVFRHKLSRCLFGNSYTRAAMETENNLTLNKKTFFDSKSFSCGNPTPGGGST